MTPSNYGGGSMPAQPPRARQDWQACPVCQGRGTDPFQTVSAGELWPCPHCRGERVVQLSDGGRETPYLKLYRDAERRAEAWHRKYDRWRERAVDGALEYGRLQVRLARAEEALRLIATPRRSDGTYNRSREACEQLARDTLAHSDRKETA